MVSFSYNHLTPKIGVTMTPLFLQCMLWNVVLIMQAGILCLCASDSFAFTLQFASALVLAKERNALFGNLP